MDFSGYTIITDLDGTFLGKGGKLVSRNLEAVERFKAGGGRFTIATGRLHLNIRSVLGEPADLVNAPIVCCNGAYLYDPVSRFIRDGDLIPEADARAILHFIRTYIPDVSFRVSSPHSVRVESMVGEAARDTLGFDEGRTEVWAPAEEWPMNDWFKIVFRGEGESMARALGIFREMLGDRLTATVSGSRLWEVQGPGITKALGLQKLKEVLGDGEERLLIACGDQENDLAMLQAADVAICPSNAIEAVKAVSAHTLCSCDEGVIADVVEAIEQGKIRKGSVTV